MTGTEAEARHFLPVSNAPAPYERSRAQVRPAAPSLPADFIALATVVLSMTMVIATVTVLYFLREVFIPLAMAILLSFVLAPAMRFLQRLHCPRIVAAVGTVLAAFGVIFMLGTVMASSMRELAENLPRYQTTLHEKVQTVRGLTAGSRTLDQAASILQDLGNELKASKSITRDAATGEPQKPVPVIIREPDPGFTRTITSLITPLLNPLAMTGVIIVFVIFILVRREDLRDRLIRLTGTRDLGRTTAAFNDAAHRLSRFYLTQLGLNASFGIAVGLGLWAVGVPSPAIWGILAGVLRFVPYIGSIISAVLPLSLAAAVEPGWTKVVEAGVMFAIIETIVGQVLEPLVYGRSTGLSPVAVVVSATFWTWLWGPIGLVLATPLTMCLVVLGRHVERLRFLEIMFGNRPALSPAEIFYQRMLAADPAEAADHAEQFLKKRSLLTYYESVVMAGLRFAQADIESALLDREQVATLVSAAGEVVIDLHSEDARPSGGLVPVDAETEAALAENGEIEVPPLPFLTPEDRRNDWGDDAVLCIAGASELDEIAARILAQILGKHGLPARELPPSALRSADLFRLDLSGARWICLSFMDSTSPAHVRHAVKKLRRKAPAAEIVVGAWSADNERLRAIGAEAQTLTMVRTLHEATEAALRAGTADGKTAASPSPPADDSALRNAS